MPTGVLGNLTPDQEARLQQLWMFLLNAFDGADSINSSSSNSNNINNISGNGNITAGRASFDEPCSPNSFDTIRSGSRLSLASQTTNNNTAINNINVNTYNNINNNAHLPPTPTSPLASPFSPSQPPRKLRRRTSLLSNASETFISRTASTHKRAMSFQPQSMGGVALRPSPANAAAMRRVMASYKMSPDELRRGLLSSLRNDHPDAMLLRFLRAKKWDVGKAFVLLVAAMSWRVRKMHVDEDIIPRGELYALQQTRSANRREQKAGNDFIKQLRMGKNIIHGVDREGRPIIDIRVRLHHADDQSDAVLERYIVHTIECCRLLLQPPELETATLIFDMTDFSMANMDYTPVRFIIKCLENYYPESLGLILIHKAPWFFSASWKIIKAWMNDSLKARVHFTKTLDDLTQFIAPENIPADLGGPDNYQYRYLEPDLHDKAETLAQDTYSPTREFLTGQRQRIASEMLDATRLWLQTSAMRDRIGTALQFDRRVELIEELRLNFWRLDPFVRARTHLDREGVIVADGIGSINMYPHRTEMMAERRHSSSSRGLGSASGSEHSAAVASSVATASFMQGGVASMSVRSDNDSGSASYDFALTSHISDDTETENSMSMRDSFMREYDDSMAASIVVSEVDELPALQPQPQPQPQPQQLQPPQEKEAQPAKLAQPEMGIDSDSDSDFDFDDDEDVEIHDAVTHMVGGRGNRSGSVGFVPGAAVRVVNV